ncbi:hypothetical protein AALT_g11525 [Alternaria alternata]|nr:hypothetical protein AALT_g11525 [Alternaria alternata]
MAQKTKPKPWDSVFEHEAKKELLLTPISEESFNMKIQSHGDSRWKINLVPQDFPDIKSLLDQGYELVDFRPYFQDILSVAGETYHPDQRVDKVMNLWSQEKGKVLEWTSYSHQLVGTKQALQVEQDTSHVLRQQLDAEQKTSQALKQQLDAEQKTSLRLRQQVLYTQMHEFLPGPSLILKNERIDRYTTIMQNDSSISHNSVPTWGAARSEVGTTGGPGNTTHIDPQPGYQSHLTQEMRHSNWD